MQEQKHDLERIHTSVAGVALSLIVGGLWVQFGGGVACVVLGVLLLSGVVYARTRG